MNRFWERLRIGDGAGKGRPSHGDIMLFSFFELADELYGRFEELTGGSAEGNDAYGRTVEAKGYYPHIREFYGLWKGRESVRRQEVGEEIAVGVRKAATEWADGVW